MYVRTCGSQQGGRGGGGQGREGFLSRDGLGWSVPVCPGIVAGRPDADDGISMLGMYKRDLMTEFRK